MNARRHNAATERRGFTLLETILAASLGTLLVLVCMGIFGAIDRTDRASMNRARETEMLGRVHTVMERVFADLVISESPINTDIGNVRNAVATGRLTGIAGKSDDGSNTVAPDAARNGESTAPPRERIMLGADRNPLLKSKMQSLKLGDGSLQRMEVLVSRPPVPTGFGRSTLAEIVEAMAVEPTGPTRGAFELRPDATTPQTSIGDLNEIDPESTGYTLWWRPLPATEELQTPDPYLMDPTEDPTAVVLATGLVQCKWTAFKTKYDEAGKSLGRERLTEMQGSVLQDLPAYFEMEIRTASGLTANWMFEAGWSFGPETVDEETGANPNGDVGGGAGGGGGGGGRGGAGGLNAGIRGRGPGADPTAGNGRGGQGRGGQGRGGQGGGRGGQGGGQGGGKGGGGRGGR